LKKPACEGLNLSKLSAYYIYIIKLSHKFLTQWHEPFIRSLQVRFWGRNIALKTWGISL